jgi:amidohydrolase
MLVELPAPHDELVGVRRRLHAHPELSMIEHETARFVADELRRLNIDDVRTAVGKTGVLGTLRGGQPGPTTLLRADMDALPVRELTGTEYRSKIDGVMHACGHDGHVSILLAAAKTLAARRDHVHGTLVFCFQPGEEGAGGNKLMIDDGALENPHVDRTFALHLYTGLDVGKIGVRDGAFFASADEIYLWVKGKGGHGAMPEKAVDPIVAASHLVTMLQSIVSREIAARDPAVVTIGKFSAGTTFNVIPDEAELAGTVRCFDREIRRSMPERIARIVNGLSDAMRVETRFEYNFNYPPTVNDPAVNDVVRAVGRQVAGESNVVDEHEIVMWAEDMAFMQEERPGAYFVVGARGSDETGYPHHSGHFNIDERALDVGYRMMVGIALAT